MRATKTRDFAWRTLDVEHTAIRGLLDALSEDEMTRPNTIQYGLYSDQELSFKDLLAHLICYEAYSLEALEEWRSGRKHWIIDGFRSGKEDLRVHYEGISVRRPHSLAQVLNEWDRTQSGLVAAIMEMTDTDWKSAAPFKNDYPLDQGGMFEIILCVPPRPPYRHLPVHIPDPDAYVRKLRNGTQNA